MVTRRLNPTGVTHTALVLFLSMLFPLTSSPSVSVAAVVTNITPSALPSCPGPCGVGVTIVTPLPPAQGGTITITGGARPGNGPNLFHSFGRFDVGTGDIANFFNETGLPTSNILSRVTGGNPSQIYGTILTTDFPGANLFLMNPAGVLFGATAVLDLGAVTGSAVRQPGSFYATTADYLKLVDENGTSSPFYADLAKTSVLSVAPVAAFGFTASNPVSITLEGSSLVVGQGKTLSFIGGNAPFLKTVSEAPLVEEPVPSGVTVTGGRLSAPGGQIQLASVASAQEASPTEVSIADLSVTIVDPSVNQVAVLGPITLTGTAVDVSGQFEVDAFGNQIGGNSGTVRMIGKSLLMDQASVTATTVGPADGNSPAVDLRITKDATLTNQSSLSTSTTGPGRGGDVIITAGALTLKGDSNIFTRNDSVGRGGDLQLNVDTLTLAEGATLKTSNNDFSGTTDEEGNVTLGVGGDITIQGLTGPGSYATDVTITGRGSFDSSIDSEIGTINNISAFAFGFAGGKGGGVTIASQSITLNDGLITSQSTGFIGPGGDIDLGLRQLTISNGGQITSLAGSFDPGSLGGKITIHELAEGLAPSVALSGSGINGLSAIFSQSTGSANPGEISITTGTLSLTDGAVIKNGDVLFQGASVTIHASDSVHVTTGSAISSQAIFQDAGGLVITTPTLSMNQGLITTSTSDVGKAGDVTFNVRALTLENGSRVESSTVGSGSAGSITVQGFDGTAGSRADSVRIRGQSGLFTETGKVGTLEIPEAEGAGGNIKVVTNTFTLEDGASISAASSSISPLAKGGSITVDANLATVRTGAFITAESIRTTEEGGAAPGGDVGITAQALTLDHGSISAATAGSGGGGSITVNVGTFMAQGNSQITSSSTETATGAAGSVTIQGLASPADAVTLTNSSLRTSADSTGRGGSITVDATNLTLNGATISASVKDVNTDDGTDGPTSGIGNIALTSSTMHMTGGTVTAETSGTRNAGTITLTTTGNTLNVDGGSITSSTTSSGNAGQILITSPVLSLNNSTITTSTISTGNAGDITANVGTLTLTNAAEIASSSTGTMSNAGDAGSVTLKASGSFTSNASTVSTSAENARGGDILIKAQSVQLSNGTLISASSNAPFSDLGEGNAGNITIHSGSTFVMQNSSVTTEASHASGGEIEIKAPDVGGMVQLINSRVSTSVGGLAGKSDGGNINIDPQFVILQNSQILAQAVAGAGGAIDITAGVFLADPASIVDASSTLGISGTVNIESSVQNVGGRLTPLSQQFSSAAALLAQRCAARVADGKFSTFVVAGREGLPVEPGGFLASPSLTAELLGSSLAGRYPHTPIAAVTGLFPEYDARPIQVAKYGDACRQ
jgi:filamentous hemagglutinin family protein